MTDAKFTHPTLHVIDGASRRVLWQEKHSAAAWFNDHQIITKGEMRYRILKQQTEVHHYYVWVEALAD